MHYLLVTVLGLALAGMGYGPAVIFGGMILLAISFVMGEIYKQGERLTVTLGDHSEPLSDRIDDGHSELTASVAVLTKELAAMAQQLHVMRGELVAVRVSLAGKPKGPWET